MFDSPSKARGAEAKASVHSIPHRPAGGRRWRSSNAEQSLPTLAYFGEPDHWGRNRAALEGAMNLFQVGETFSSKELAGSTIHVTLNNDYLAAYLATPFLGGEEPTSFALDSGVGHPFDVAQVLTRIFAGGAARTKIANSIGGLDPEPPDHAMPRVTERPHDGSHNRGVKTMSVSKTALVVALATAMVLKPMGEAAASPAGDALEADAEYALQMLYDSSPSAAQMGKDAKAILVFPDVVKIGFMFAGGFGEGVLIKDGKWQVTTARRAAPTASRLARTATAMPCS